MQPPGQPALSWVPFFFHYSLVSCLGQLSSSLASIWPESVRLCRPTRACMPLPSGMLDLDPNLFSPWDGGLLLLASSTHPWSLLPARLPPPPSSSVLTACLMTTVPLSLSIPLL